MLEQIPLELRALHQWVVAGTNKLPLNPMTGSAADVTDPSTWGTFEQATQAGYKHIGFVLSPEDPYVIIDLDDPYSKVKSDGTPRYSQEQCDTIAARQDKIMAHCQTYTELSQSGKGHHLIARGSIPRGRNKDEVEVYSQSRHMICTGNNVNDLPITDQQAIVDILYNEMAPVSTTHLEQHDSHLTDVELVDMAMGASNADKFNRLCNGEYGGEYGSQSEADFALLSIIAFYTQDNEQVRRIFRCSVLGKREKAQKNDTYLNFALGKIRAKQPPPVDLSALQIKPEPPKPAPIPKAPTKPSKPPKPVAKIPKPKPKAPKPPKKDVTSRPEYAFPPGLVGEIAEYIYASAIRPVHEIALTAAISLVAGVAGRSYNVSGTGLNQYLILLARTGTGKEGAASGIDTLIAATRPTIPMIEQFMGPSAFASGQALIRVLDERPAFVSILGEFGLTLQQLCDPRASGPEKMLRRVLLDLYSKSGWTKTLRSSVYSDVEKNTKIVQAPNVTIFGESTPETFYGGLDQSHIAEGLIPRFSVVEYTGPRPPRNPNAFCQPPETLVKRFADLAAVAINTHNNCTCCPIQIDAESLALFNAFDTEADNNINHSTNNEVELQLWNRAHLKSLKMAALLAVGVDPHQPIVTKDLAEWAIAFVRADIGTMLAKFTTGEVGQGEHRLEKDVRRAADNYFTLTTKQKLSYKVPNALLDHKVIPYSYFRARLRLLTGFKNHRLGVTRAIKDTLQDLVDSEVLIEIPQVQVRSEFRVSQAVYSLGPGW